MNKSEDKIVRFTLDLENSNNLPTLTTEQLEALDLAEIDYSDIPEIPSGFWDKSRNC